MSRSNENPGRGIRRGPGRRFLEGQRNQLITQMKRRYIPYAL